MRHFFFFFSLILVVGCEAEGKWSLDLVFPAGENPLASADRLDVIVSGHSAKSFALDDPEDISISFDLDVKSEEGTIALLGYQGDSLIARGETPQLYLKPQNEAFKLLVAQTEALSKLDISLPVAIESPITTTFAGVGVFIGGGFVDSEPSGRSFYYDPYDHQVIEFEESAPRIGANAISCGLTCLYMIGGEKDEGYADQILVYNGGWQAISDQLKAEDRRKNASIIEVSSTEALIVGGENESGALDSLILVSVASGQPKLTVLDSHMSDARIKPQIAANDGVVLIHGNGSTDLYFHASKSLSPLSFDDIAPIEGAAAISIEDYIVLVGGKDKNGEFINGGWIIDLKAQHAQYVENILEKGRAFHLLKRYGDSIMVIGGQTADGDAERVEIVTSSLEKNRKFSASISSENIEYLSGQMHLIIDKARLDILQ